MRYRSSVMLIDIFDINYKICGYNELKLAISNNSKQNLLITNY